MSKLLPSPLAPPPLPPPLPSSESDPAVAHAGPPRVFTCAQCGTRIAHTARLVSTAYRGHAGKAALFSELRNVALDPPSILLMDSGAYTIQEFICTKCEAYLGWKFTRAHDGPERWKEGCFVLELDFVEAQDLDDHDHDPDNDRAAAGVQRVMSPAPRSANGLHRRTMSAATDTHPHPAVVVSRPATPKGVREGLRSLQAGAAAQRRVEMDDFDGGPFWKPRRSMVG